MKNATKVVYTSLESFLYELNDRAKFFPQKSNFKGSEDEYLHLGTLAKNTNIAIILVCELAGK